jgi:general secretion pathway protein B
MSYILNALRKSEQERQAKQPETITDQVLMPPAQKSRKTALLIGGLLAVNLLALPVLVWYLKKADDTPAKPQAHAQPLPKKAVQKTLPIPLNSVDDKTVSGQEAKKELTAAVMPAQETMSPSVPEAAAPAATASSIEELAAVKQAAEGKAAKEGRPDKSESSAQTAPPSGAISQQGQIRKESQARRVHGVLASRSLNNSEGEVNKSEEKKTDAASAEPQEIPLFKDLPYNFRSSAPKMSINVFMYAAKPEDRFVVLNMTKYKAGQTTKDSVEIREIRPDGIIASYGGEVFRIERP